MSTTISSMPSVTLPRFVSASSTASCALQKKKGSDGATAPSSAGTSLANQTTWGSGSNLVQTSTGGDPLDFDLLAEYLLEDSAGSAGGLGISFDFTSETPPLPLAENSGIVSPDQAETSFADPLADATEQMRHATASAPNGDIAGDLAQVQQMIATQAAAAEQRIAAPEAPKASVCAPMPSAPPLSSFPPATPVPAGTLPAPSLVGAATTELPHQPILSTTDANKRRRVDASAPVVAAATAAPVGSVTALNDQLLPPNFPQRGGRQKTQAQIDRRRERNRILARRTRLRKKFFFESLQKEVTDLQRENAVLKHIVRDRLNPDVAKGILDQCTANDQLPDIMTDNGDTELDRQDFSFIKSVQKSQQCFVITDPSLQDNPIVYASDDFLALTGYSREDVLGRNCRFLQGTETSPAKVAQIRKAVEIGEDCSVTLINYTADGTAFWNNLFIAALRDAENNIVNFIGVIVKVASPEPSDPEAGKKLPGEASPNSVMNSGSLDSVIGSSLDAAAAAAEAADGTVKAIEGALATAIDPKKDPES